MGRPPTPTALKVIRGTDRQDRTNAQEPKPKAGARPPAWLSRDARKHWRRIAPVLDELGILTVADAESLALLCDSLAEYLDASARIESDGMVYETTTERGSVMLRKHPAIEIKATARTAIDRLLTGFGMNPAARSRVSAAKDAESDPFDEFLSDARRAAR